MWDLFPAAGPAGIVGGGGYSGATQGKAEILSGIDFNYNPTSTNAAPDGTPLALAYATTTSDRDDPNTSDNIIFDEVQIVSGGVTIVGSTITLPQSDIPYELTWNGGFVFDGAPDDDIEITFVGSTAPLLQTTAEADAVSYTHLTLPTICSV